MGKTNYKHTFPLIAFLMSLALIGKLMIEFVFVCIVTMAIGAVLFYIFLGFMYGVDRIIDFFYEFYEAR
jgi:hypothetical protein